ncbi:hypothetical protein GLOTRDRAFT_132881 [Gloeophyllum trabeum ATCC 11539]|uniref:ferric-chelate reductase (NADPH) n=1 Tax=Gloeophyllum trabeum (strain ATCC 11539 / FP-39264 / Madison 617) TaxID=670483 RepID=S7PVJ4_GLOTA|nr:uncharacterized protein GLOTRDRAFT_132881 [Gloeophyllum trabeum ATCC 11539]EPQ51513.1 hypothetical protein GLOTRDRAFT_132881 [Gloeophyllum trabeum ATCC 11539]
MSTVEEREERQILINDLYPIQTWYAWAAVIGLATLVNVLSRLISLVNRYASSKTKNAGTGRPALWRVPLALANAWRVVAYRSTVNFGWGYTMNVLEFFLTVSYLSAILAWAFAHSSPADFEGVEYAADFMANRMGTIATAQFPLVTVLGTKNNIISFLTGVGHDKLNYLHRMTARVAFLMLWMHAGRWMPPSLLPSIWYETVWVRTGVLGLVAFTILTFTSIRPAREKAYEWFLWGHFALVFIFLVGGYFHTKRCLYDPWIIACFAIWAFDRLVRVLRVSYFSLASRFSKSHPPSAPSSATSFETRATVELLTPHHVSLRLQRPRGFHWAPGQTAYLMAPGVSVLPWEAHPFTIGSVDESRYADSDARAVEEEGDASSMEKKGHGDGEEKGAADELVFIIGLMQGFTGRLGKRVLGGESRRHVTALTEGPYGDGEDVIGYDTVVLVAGGTGVAWTLPLLVDTIRRGNSKSRQCHRLVFIWAIKEQDHVSWIADPLTRLLPQIRALTDMDVSIRLFITRNRNFSTPNVDVAGLEQNAGASPSATPDTMDAKSLEEGGPCQDVDAVLRAPCVQVSSGRPEVAGLVGAEIDGCRERRGKNVFVGVCGSASLAEAVRVGARVNPLWGPNSVLRGGPNVVLKVESFGYA